MSLQNTTQISLNNKNKLLTDIIYYFSDTQQSLFIFMIIIFIIKFLL